MKLEFYYKKKTRKVLKHRDAKQCAAKQTFINKEIIEEIKKKSETNEMQYSCPRSMGPRKNSAKWEAHTNIGLPQNLRKLSNKQCKCTLEKKKKLQEKEAKIYQKGGNNKYQSGNK